MLSIGGNTSTTPRPTWFCDMREHSTFFTKVRFGSQPRFSTFIDFCMRSQEQTRILIFVYCSKAYLMRMVDFLFLLLFNRTMCVNVNTMCTSFVCLFAEGDGKISGRRDCLFKKHFYFVQQQLFEQETGDLKTNVVMMLVYASCSCC